MFYGVKIGIYQEILWRCGDFEQQLRKAVACGFDVVDFSDLKAYDFPLFALSPSDYETTLRQYATIASDCGVEISQVHAPGGPVAAEPTPSDRAKRLAYTCRAVEGAAMLGCPRLVMHPFYPYATRDLSHAEETRDINAELLRKVCDKGRECGVVICLENTPSLRYSLATARDVAELVREINDPQLRVCLDTGHCAYFEMQPAKAVRQIGGELLEALHIHDNNGREDQHRLPYDGIIDWTDFARALGEAGFGGVLTLELRKKTQLPEALFDDYLRHAYRRAAYIAALVQSEKH